MKNITLLLSISTFLGFAQSFRKNEWQLELVQILFRNGVSAPDALYPTDPNNPDVWEEGLGQLTLVGQKQLYALGKRLKQQYRYFLTSNPHEVKVMSTYLDKCMSSALCLLASLYEPNESWEFIPGLNWQPIPVYYKPPHVDTLMHSFNNFENMNVELIPAIKRKLTHYKEQLKYWTLHSGMPVTDFSKVSNLRKIIFTQYISNQTIPYWAWEYWNDLQNLSDFLYRITFTEHFILKIVGGPLLTEMVNNAIYKSEGRKRSTKIFIYSGQSAHVSGVLGALKLFNNKEPPYAATFVMELMRRNRHSKPEEVEYGIRLGYFNETDANLRIGEPKLLILPDCTEVCPLNAFLYHVRHWIKPNWRSLRSQDL